MPYEDNVNIDPFHRSVKGKHGGFLCRRNIQHERAAVEAVLIYRQNETSFEVKENA